MKIEIPEFPNLPARIGRLRDLSHNLWWCWNADARRMFSTLGRLHWPGTQQNPVLMLQQMPVSALEAMADDPSFLELYDRVIAQFDSYMQPAETWFSRHCGGMSPQLVAYFCAEFAVHTSVPIYSGGLGLLAGDTCKEASDLGVPWVAVGALYPEGYFRQKIGADGSQETFYERILTGETPLLPVLNQDGSRLLVEVPLDHRNIRVCIWKMQVGRVPVFLLDSDIPENEPWDRDLVARLYGGDNQVRLRQEIILGVGGVKVLRALGYQPTVFHLNEGHAAFAALELIRESCQSGSSWSDAIESVREQLVFTTHTPVKAGHDEFPFHMMEEHFRTYWTDLGVTREQVLELGSSPGGGHQFSMTVLALKTARSTNGVSRRHGEVSREMWQFLYAGKSVEEVPITHVTNGVHVPTWLSGGMVKLYTRYLGTGWREVHDQPEIWDRILQVPDDEFWATHQRLKTKLIHFMRQRARQRWTKDAVSAGQLVSLGVMLNPDTLTIGFARRFATYKRATLILRDVERLRRLITDPWRPVQLVFAGKPHPADEPGKYLLRQVFEACIDPKFGGRIAFIENYDKQVAHHLVNGVDVWLNNPEPPKEASGTSGQKASLNGVPNLSVLDGWWCEGFNGRNGWSIDGDTDEEAAGSLYRILEEEIVPRYYRRDSNGVPREWVAWMKEAVRSTAAPFSARRMVKEYLTKVYGFTVSGGRRS